MATISVSVGQNGQNRVEDVRLVQQLLNAIPIDHGGPQLKLGVDGQVGPKTIEAIRQFQQHYHLAIDGRVDPGGATLAKLCQIAGESASGICIVFSPDAKKEVVSTYTLTVLEEILTKAQLSGVTITSTSRTVEDQARIMFNNIRSKGVDNQKELYGPNGDKVIDVYVAAKKDGKTDQQIIGLMVDKINELGPGNVSKHIADPQKLNVIDIAPSSITNKSAFVQAVNADKRVSKFLTPPADPAYHLEIPQPQ